MVAPAKHKWEFAARFRKNAFGWRSQPAVKRVKEAVSEIKKVARKDPVTGAEGAVRFLVKVSPAIAHVDGSSGAMGTAVNNAIEALVPIIAKAPADDGLREKWLERLWDAVEADQIPYLESIPEHWGTLCAGTGRASRWADEFIAKVRSAWGPNAARDISYDRVAACLSSLFSAGRNEEIVALLALKPKTLWHYRQWGVKALAAMGRKGDAIRFAEESRDAYTPHSLIALACEEILLSSGMADEAYTRYAREANEKTTYLATFRAIAKKYPHKDPADIIRDLAEASPGEEGKWFAAAKSAGLYDLAVELANRTPCDPRTLTRAARDMAEKEPRFALEAGIAALRWLVEGYGYDITGLDVMAAYNHTMQAAENAGCAPETAVRVRELVAGETFGERFVTQILGRQLGLND